jgi:hypothetical protein
MLYRPYAQAPTDFMALVVRTSVEPSAVIPDVLTALKSVDAEQPVFDVLTYRRLLQQRTLGCSTSPLSWLSSASSR